MADLEGLKREAALAAIALVTDGMVVGLGTGSTATYAVAGLGARMRDEGLKIIGIPTSERTAAQARSEGIPLTSLAEHRRIDLTIDGADEVVRGPLDLVKGLGGALLREKIVAQASARLVIVADWTKLVKHLGERAPLPVEVTQFGWHSTADRLEALGTTPVQRLGADGAPYVTDGGNYILDCRFTAITDPSALQDRLRRITGVVESGLFIGMAERVYIAAPDGVELLTRTA